jgi:hypothetical protein
MVYTVATGMVPKQQMEIYSLDIVGFSLKICVSFYMILQVFKNQNQLYQRNMYFHLLCNQQQLNTTS